MTIMHIDKTGTHVGTVGGKLTDAEVRRIMGPGASGDHVFLKSFTPLGTVVRSMSCAELVEASLKRAPTVYFLRACAGTLGPTFFDLRV